MQTEHRIIQGDCLEKLKSIPDKSIDLVFADPPYNMSKKQGLQWKYSRHVTMQEAWDIFSKDDFFDFNLKWLSECSRVLRNGGSLWVSGSFHNIYQLGFIIQNLPDIKIKNSVVWFKPNAQPNITCRFFTESTEHLIWASKNGKNQKWKFNYETTKKDIYDDINPRGKQTRNVWSIPLTPPSEKKAGSHPTQKPIELLRRIIVSCTDKGDTVLDPFAGSGTTNLVAMRLERNSIGIEKDKDVALVNKRLVEEANNKLFKEARIIIE
jgi:site-specific DNA-methyltransferase (adenine-specific)